MTRSGAHVITKQVLSLIAACFALFFTTAARADLTKQLDDAKLIATRVQAELQQARDASAELERKLKNATDRAAQQEFRAIRAETDLQNLQAKLKKR